MATAIANDEIIKSFVLDNKFAKISEFILWIMDNSDDWHKPRMTSLRYFHSNWAKIANLNREKLRNSESNVVNSDRMEKAKLLLNKGNNG